MSAAACGSVSGNDPDPDAPPGDGASVEPGTPRWVRSLSSATGTGVAETSTGLVLTGYMTAPVDLGGGVLVPAGMTDSVVAGFSPEGEHQYSVRVGGAGQEYLFLETADAGTPIAHGVSYGDVDLGKGPVPGGGGPGADGFIGRYGTGEPGWVQRITGPGEDKIVTTAIGSSSAVWAAGFFEGTTTFNATSYVSTGGSRDILIARFNAFTGAVQLTLLLGSAARDEATSIAASGTDVVVGGLFEGTLTFSPAVAHTSAGGLDAFVSKFDASGALIWAKRFGGTGNDREPRIAIDAAGDIYVAGQFQNEVAFGQVNLISKGLGDVFVAKLRGSDGAVQWATSFGSTLDDNPGRLAFDSRGRVAVTTTVGGPVDGAPSAGGLDAYIATFDASNGAKRWQRTYSTPGDDRAWSIIFGRDGDLFATISIAGELDFGRPIIGAPAPVGVLLRIAP